MSSKEILVVGSKVKAIVSNEKMRSDGSLVEAVSAKVETMMHDAIERARKNGRSTVRPQDL
jgi:histone H3/H4